MKIIWTFPIDLIEELIWAWESALFTETLAVSDENLMKLSKKHECFKVFFQDADVVR